MNNIEIAKRVVLDYFNLTESEILSKGENGNLSRKREHVEARRIIYSIVKFLEQPPSLRMIPIFCFNIEQDHSTVIHQLKTHSDLMASDKDYKKRYFEIIENYERLKPDYRFPYKKQEAISISQINLERCLQVAI